MSIRFIETPYFQLSKIQRKNLKIKNTSGTKIYLDDSASKKNRSIGITGNIIQNGEPSPINPVPINNTGDEGYINEIKGNRNLAVNTFEDKLKVTASGSDRILEVATYKTSQIIRVQPNKTYVIDGDFSVFSDRNCRVRAFNNYPELGAVDLSTPFAFNNTRFTITTDANTNYLLIYNSQDVKNIVVPNMFVCEQQYADTYVAHEEQVINFPLTQGQKFYGGDYLADDGIHHVRKEIVYDGSDDENWSLSSSGFFVSGIVENIPYRTINTLCNIATVKHISDLHSGDINKYAVRSVTGGYDYFWFSCPQFETLIAWKTYLAEHPITVQYELAEEDIEAYTQEQQAVWNQIKALRTYKNVTTINSSNSVPATVNIKYYAKI